MNMINDKENEDIALESQTKIFKALTHPTRIAILQILRDGEHCVCHIEAYLGFRQSYISQQLAVLREAGIIQDRRDGWNIFYRVVDPQIFAVLDSVQNLTGVGGSGLQREKVNCTCPHCSLKIDVS